MEARAAQALDELGRYFCYLGEIHWCLHTGTRTPGLWYGGYQRPSQSSLLRVEDYLVVARACAERVGEPVAGRWLYLAVCYDRFGYRLRKRLRPLGPGDLAEVLAALEADIAAGSLPQPSKRPSVSERFSKHLSPWLPEPQDSALQALLPGLI